MAFPIGWHFRGYLPHFDGGEICQSVTFRLADALPREKLDELRRGAKRVEIEAWLDQGCGKCLLAEALPVKTTRK